MFKASSLPLCASVLVVAAGLGTSSGAWAMPIVYDFLGSDPINNGTGSATMTLDGNGTNTITVRVWNTSPIGLDGMAVGGNAPALTAFGFDLDPNGVDYDNVDESLSTLIAFDEDGNSTGNLLPTDWGLGNMSDGVFLDFLAMADLGVQGGLYNPDCLGDINCSDTLAAAPRYFTKATLSLTFDQPVSFVFDSNGKAESPKGTGSPVVRFQNVGEDGEGSLKIVGTPGTPVPEPGTLFLLGIGLVGLTLGHRRLGRSAA